MERLQGIKKNCVDMAAKKYNMKNDSLFEKVCSSTQFPKLKNSGSENNMMLYNQNYKNMDNYKKKLVTDDDIDYKEGITEILNKANSIIQKGPPKDEENSLDKNQTKENQLLFPKDSNTKENNTDNNYKTVQLINFKQNYRNNIKLFKTPIRNFIIKKNRGDKNNMFSLNKIKKLKNMKIILNF